MRQILSRLARRLEPTYGQKLSLLAAVPVILAAALIALVVTAQTRALADSEINSLQERLIDAKREELKNYISIARTAFVNIYGRAAPDDELAKLEVTRILAAMLYGQDGYFFVFDYDGNNLVAPRQTYLINRNWSGLTDIHGVPVTDELIRIARGGGGYHEFDWPKPSTHETARMVVYVNGMQDWHWVIGTGIFIDDVLDDVAASRAEVDGRIARTSLYIVAIAVVALLGVFLSGLVLNIRERRLADAKLKALTQRIVNTQEEERGRVARELHDSISQMLVGARYTFELARRRLQKADERANESLDKGIASLGGAIAEVRRISRDLRPSMLDDLGLGPALKSMTEDFSARTGIEVKFETVVFRNRLDQDARIALYRIAQEAMTNIERHAKATGVTLTVKGHRTGAILQISDNGIGMASAGGEQRGLGLRNMAERMEQLGGTFKFTANGNGTTIEAQVPLSHMMPPESRRDQS